MKWTVMRKLYFWFAVALMAINIPLLFTDAFSKDKFVKVVLAAQVALICLQPEQITGESK